MPTYIFPIVFLYYSISFNLTTGNTPLLPQFPLRHGPQKHYDEKKTEDKTWPYLVLSTMTTFHLGFGLVWFDFGFFNGVRKSLSTYSNYSKRWNRQ